MSEVKSVDVEFNIGTGTVLTGSMVNEYIPLGYQSGQRIGRVINMTRLDIKGYLVRDYNYKTEKYPTVARVMVVYDKQSNNNFPTLSDILTPGTLTSPEYAMNDMANRFFEERFDILWDKRFHWDYFDMSATADESNGDNESVKLIDVSIPIGYNSVWDNVSGRPDTGSLTLLFWSTDPGVTDLISIRSRMRLFYMD